MTIRNVPVFAAAWVFFLATTQLSGTPGGPDPVLFTVPVIQQAPALVTGARAVEDAKSNRHVGRLIITNKFSHPLTAIQVGWLLRLCGAEKAHLMKCRENTPFLIGLGKRQQLTLQPGKETELAAFLFSINRELIPSLRARGVDPAQFMVAELGVVYARFADGAEWQYDIGTNGEWNWTPTSGPQAANRMEKISWKAADGCSTCNFEGCANEDCFSFPYPINCCWGGVATCFTRSCTVGPCP